MRITTSLLLAAVLTAGCAVTPQSASRQGDMYLCSSYGEAIRTKRAQDLAVLGAELAKRQLALNAAEEAAASRGTIAVGMSECALFASWGIPDVRNTTTTARGVRVQHVWRGFSGQYIRTASNYAYTENGRVVAVQN